MKDSKDKENRISNLKNMFDHMNDDETEEKSEEKKDELDDIEEDEELINFLNEGMEEYELDDEYIYRPGKESIEAINLEDDAPINISINNITKTFNSSHYITTNSDSNQDKKLNLSDSD